MAHEEAAYGSYNWLEILHYELLGSSPVPSSRCTWISAILCSVVVGLSGLVPLLFFRQEVVYVGKTRKNSEPCQDDPAPPAEWNSNKLKFMLGFAVGGLLGDVFLHLLPEALERATTARGGDGVAGASSVGFWTLVGILAFVAIEILCSIERGKKPGIGCRTDMIVGYLNLLANCVDNFAHGLAIGGAFLISSRIGFVTTLCILVHEIPHEFGDFAILLKSGFNRREAAKAQASTAALGMCGAVTALALDSVTAINCYTSWILPFTCGGFLNIALVTVLPDLIGSKDVCDCLRTLMGIGSGLLTVVGASSM